MLRALGIILNPLGALFLFIFGWLGRRIDGILSPVIGLVAALLVILWAVSLAVTLLYTARGEIGIATGLTPPPAFIQGVGHVVDITEEARVSSKRVRQDLVIAYAIGGRSGTFEETRRSLREDAVRIGDRLNVYLVEGTGPGLKAPHGRGFSIFLSVICAAISLLVLYWARRYVRHRWRIFAGTRSKAPQPTWTPPRQTRGKAMPRLAGSAPTAPQVVLRGNEKPMSTAERMKADAERARVKTQRS